MLLPAGQIFDRRYRLDAPLGRPVACYLAGPRDGTSRRALGSQQWRTMPGRSRGGEVFLSLTKRDHP